MLSSEDGNPVKGPGWQGCTPLTPNTITKNSDPASITLTAKAGWYLVKHPDINGGFGVWVYNDIDTVIVNNLTHVAPGAPLKVESYGIIVKPTTIQCTTSSQPSTTEDTSLQDQSSINVVNGPCGAARMQLEVIGFGIVQDVKAGEYWAIILTTLQTDATAQATFSNNYVIKTTT